MGNLTDIKHHIKSVSDTRQITSAMETISVAKMRKAMSQYDKCKIFFDKVLDTIDAIAAKAVDLGESKRYFVTPNPNANKLYIVIASDKGLAGGYNTNIFKHAWEQIKDIKNVNVFTVGQTTREFFEKKGCMVDVEFVDAAYKPHRLDAKEIADTILNLYNSGQISSIYICYTKLLNSTVMYPETLELLPFSKVDSIKRLKDKNLYKDDISELSFDPNPQTVLEGLIPQYLMWTIYGALIQSYAGEQSSRRFAMSNATKNADEILDNLRLEYNQARQERITNELNEIITGAMGVSKEEQRS